MVEKCSYCGEEGHSIQQCPKWKERQQKFGLPEFTPMHLDKLERFEYLIDGETFRKLFVENGGTESMATHLWEKFHEIYNHSILKLWRSLDSSNREIMLRVINRWVGLIPISMM